MRRFTVFCILLAFFNVTSWAQSTLSLASPIHGVPPKGAPEGSRPSSTDNGIQYHGGLVMNDPHGFNVYLIWYGDWKNNTEPAIVTDFVKHLGGTAYFNINTSYYDHNPGGEKDPVVNRVNYGCSIPGNQACNLPLIIDGECLIVGVDGSTFYASLWQNGTVTNLGSASRRFCRVRHW